MAKRDFYNVMGVSRNTSVEEIKKAYKRLAKKYHPDKNRGDKVSEDKFKEISEAYHVLSDPEKRKQYDLFGHNGPQGASGHGGRNPGAGQSSGYHWSSGPGASGFGFEDLHGGGSGFRDIFSQFFGNARKGSNPKTDFSGANPFGSGFDMTGAAVQDVEAEITIRFDEAIQGGKHRISLQRNGYCPSCQGSGKNRSGASTSCSACNGTGGKQVGNAGTHFSIVCNTCSGTGRIFSEPCTTCHGSGKAGGTDTLTVNIPPGVKDGGRLRIPGKGGVGPNGNAGDLYLRIHVTPHRFFKREGNNLHLDLPVTASEAVLGARVDVPTLDGKAMLKIPPCTQNRSVLRMKGKGVPGPKCGSKGDMLVHIQVTVPKNPDEQARNLFEQLKKLESDPREGMF